jgi:Putative lumazine-binding
MGSAGEYQMLSTSKSWMNLKHFVFSIMAHCQPSYPLLQSLKFGRTLKAKVLTGHQFTDLFTLLKIDGNWKIMNKVFYLHS